MSKGHDDLPSVTRTLADWVTEVCVTSSQIRLTVLQGSLACIHPQLHHLWSFKFCAWASR